MKQKHTNQREFDKIDTDDEKVQELRQARRRQTKYVNVAKI